MTYRNRHLLDLAKYAPCCARFDHDCKPGTVVSAHMNVGKGMAHKVPDFALAFLCAESHRLIDEGGWPRDLSRAEWQRAHWASMEWAWSNGVIGVQTPDSQPDDADERRNSDQNAKLHAMLNDIAKQVRWHGLHLTASVWKRLCTAAWLREEGERPMMVPALDGSGMDVIYERTSKLGKRRMSSLILWVEAFGGEHAVKWTDPRWFSVMNVPEANAAVKGDAEPKAERSPLEPLVGPENTDGL